MQTVDAIAAAIVAREGGYVDHPDDPGGATKHGVTIHTLRRLGLDLDGRIQAFTDPGNEPFMLPGSPRVLLTVGVDRQDPKSPVFRVVIRRHRGLPPSVEQPENRGDGTAVQANQSRQAKKASGNQRDIPWS